MRKLITIFAIPELRRKILITLLFLVIYRIGYAIPLPMIDQQKLAKSVAEQQAGPLGQVLGLVSTFSGGNLSSATIFALGIMPYISASIILQLLAASGLSPYLEKLRKEPNGQKKINEYTRYLTIPITLIQAIFWIRGVIAPEPHGKNLMAQGYNEGFDYYWFGLAAVSDGHRRNHVPDVARRANRRIRHRQWHLADHHGRHCLPHSQCHAQSPV